MDDKTHLASLKAAYKQKIQLLPFSNVLFQQKNKQQPQLLTTLHGVLVSGDEMMIINDAIKVHAEENDNNEDSDDYLTLIPRLPLSTYMKYG